MDKNYLDDDIGDVIIDGRTGEEKIVLLSEKNEEKDIRISFIKNAKGDMETIQRYGSNKADDEEE